MAEPDHRKGLPLTRAPPSGAPAGAGRPSPSGRSAIAEASARSCKLPDFALVTADHVERALDAIDAGSVPPARAARSTFLHARGRRYPVKYVLGLAHRYASGSEPDPEEFTGGTVSGKVLQRLGFEVHHLGRPLGGQAPAHAAAAAAAPAAQRAGPLARAAQPPTGATAAKVSAPGAPPRAVMTVCAVGWTSSGVQSNGLRVGRLTSVLDAALTQRPKDLLDAVVFPGGYFRLAGFIGDLTFENRVAALDAAPFGGTCRAAAARLQAHSSGALFVVGVDSDPRPGEQGDQLCVAWSPSGVVGIGRKVFPTSGDEAANLIISEDDFVDPHRVVALPSGRRAILCSCYDGFGVSDPGTRAWDIERIRAMGTVVGWRQAAFDARWRAAVSGWTALVSQVDLALIAIHFFAKGKSSSMWQRHGISTASASLRGGMAVAAAHFQARLPSASCTQTLVSKDVPASELGAGQHRRANQLAPFAERWESEELVRWFR